jgi:hypothetical protein
MSVPDYFQPSTFSRSSPHVACSDTHQRTLTRSTNYLIDSQATIHISHTRAHFKNFSPASDTVRGIDHMNDMKVVGYGSIDFTGPDDITITLSNVAYVPESTRNLISVDMITHHSGLDVIFNDVECTLTDGTVIGRYKRGSLYEFVFPPQVDDAYTITPPSGSSTLNEQVPTTELPDSSILVNQYAICLYTSASCYLAFSLYIHCDWVRIPRDVTICQSRDYYLCCVSHCCSYTLTNVCYVSQLCCRHWPSRVGACSVFLRFNHVCQVCITHSPHGYLLVFTLCDLGIIHSYTSACS